MARGFLGIERGRAEEPRGGAARACIGFYFSCKSKRAAAVAERERLSKLFFAHRPRCQVGPGELSRVGKELCREVCGICGREMCRSRKARFRREVHERRRQSGVFRRVWRSCPCERFLNHAKDAAAQQERVRHQNLKRSFDRGRFFTREQVARREKKEALELKDDIRKERRSTDVIRVAHARKTSEGRVERLLVLRLESEGIGVGTHFGFPERRARCVFRWRHGASLPSSQFARKAASSAFGSTASMPSDAATAAVRSSAASASPC